MKFILDLLNRKFDFIIPLFFIILGIIAAIFLFFVRYTVYTKRKKYYAGKKAEESERNHS